MSKTVKVEMELEAVAGYEYVGQFRKAKYGEKYLNHGIVETWPLDEPSTSQYMIMRPAVKWRDARASDLENGPVECRYKDGYQDPWMEGYFTAYSAGEDDDLRFGIGEDTASLDEWYAYCQVKDNA